MVTKKKKNKKNKKKNKQTATAENIMTLAGIKRKTKMILRDFLE